MKNFHKLMFALTAVILFASCSNDDHSENATAYFSASLVDAPGDFEQVLVDVQGIELILDGQTIRPEPFEGGVFDLLELTGGLSAQLVDTQIPVGKLSQIRLILGQENSVVVDGAEFVLQTPSAHQAGLKLNVHEDLEAGIRYDFILDFDVDKSVVDSGDGQEFILKPVIRTTTVAVSGAIGGVVSPAGTKSLVTATDGTTVVSAYTHPETGAFLLFGVPQGTYSVVVTPEEASGFPEVLLEDVQVATGSTIDLGTIDLE